MPSVEGSQSFLAISAPSPFTTGFFNPAYALPMIQNMASSLSSQSIVNPTISGAATLANDGQILSSNTNSSMLFKQVSINNHTSRTFSSRTFENNSTSVIKRKHSGYVNKSRGSKRSNETVNLKKSCPSCLKFWKNCKCSNIKNRPNPKPYCKFIPPRMLRKQNTQQ